MNIYIIVLNYNGVKNTLECIESIRKLTTKNFKITTIVVDNASSDGSQQKLNSIRDVHFIENKKNLGYSGGNNTGIRYAIDNKADYICILNNDTKVDKDLLINFIKSKRIGILSPKIYFYPGQEFHKARYKKNEHGKVIWYAGGEIDWSNVIGVHRGVDEVDIGQYDDEQEIAYATGACIFAKTDIFEKVGLFDEKYFLYLEDMDFSVRAKKLGIKIIYSPKSFLWHKNASSAGGSGSNLQDYYITRNRLMFAFKYAKIKTKLAVLRQIVSEWSNSTRRTALIDFFTFKFGNTFKP